MRKLFRLAPLRAPSFVFSLFLLLASCADQRPVALLGLESEGCSPAESSFIEKAMTEGLGAHRPVVAPLTVRRQMGEGCSAAACNEETAKALGSADVVSGKLSKKDGLWILSVERYRARDGVSMKRRWSGDSVENLAVQAQRGSGELITSE
jgi:hypothetical protein